MFSFSSRKDHLHVVWCSSVPWEMELNIFVWLQQGSSCGTAQQALPWWEVTEEKANRPTEKSPGHQRDSGWHQKMGPAGVLLVFWDDSKIISGKEGKTAKVYMKTNNPHFSFIFLREGLKFLSLENNYSKCDATSFPCFVQTVQLRSWRSRVK